MNATTALNLYVGEMGRMLSGSKKAPKGHICVWNANVIVGGKKAWYGDLDLTKDAKNLQAAANNIGQPIYILPEHAARFANENNPDMTRVVKIINPDRS